MERSIVTVSIAHSLSSLMANIHAPLFEYADYSGELIAFIAHVAHARGSLDSLLLFEDCWLTAAISSASRAAMHADEIKYSIINVPFMKVKKVVHAYPLDMDKFSFNYYIATNSCFSVSSFSSPTTIAYSFLNSLFHISRRALRGDFLINMYNYWR